MTLLSTLPILSRHELPLEPARLRQRPDVPIAEFERDGRLLAIEPISGAWALCRREARESVLADLLEKRAEWQRNPVTPEEAAPLSSVTVPLKNKHCNLRCDYCFAESEGEGGYPPAELMLRFIRLVEQLHPERLRIFVFHGGEPLVDWKLLERLVSQYRAEGSPTQGETVFSMVTNGTLVTPAIAASMRDLGIGACVSLDGPPEVHDKYRHYLLGRGSFGQALRGFEHLVEAGVKPNTISTIVDPEDVLPSFRFFRRYGLSSMFLRPLRWQGRAIALLRDVVKVEGEEAYQQRFAAALMRVADEVIEHNRCHDEKVVEHGLAVRVSHLIRKERPYMCLRSPCGAVSGHKLGLDGHGNVFPCDTMVEFPELAVTNVAALETVDDLRQALASSPVMGCLQHRRVENIDQCARCHVQRFCGGECTAASYARHGGLNREGDRCALEQTLFVELLWKIVEDLRNVEALCPGTFRPDRFAWSDDAGSC